MELVLSSNHDLGVRLFLQLLFRFLDWDSLGKSDFSLLSASKLAHLGFSPAIELTLVSNGKGIVSTTADIVDQGSLPLLAVVEGFDILGSASNLDTVSETELAFETSAPSVHIVFASQGERMVFTASNLDDPVVSERLQYLRIRSFSRSSMPSS